MGVLYHDHMAEQLSLVVLVVALATGLVTSLVTISQAQERQPAFFRYFLTNILLFNLLILAGLVFRYIQLQLQAPELQPYTVVLPVLLVLMAALKLGWLYAFVVMSRTLPCDIVPRQSAGRYARAALGIFLSCLALTAIAVWMHLETLLQITVILIESLVVGGALLATGRLIRDAMELPVGQRRKSVLIFCGYHLGLFVLILVVLVSGWLQPGPQSQAQILTNGGFLALFNFCALVWVRWFSPPHNVSRFERFELLGITPREREVIELIGAGKTNQEIADKLFISVATVKDHNHKLFRKTGVRNRVELAKLFR
jgi:DNA-binding CsgD family transcriptional regulator